MSAVPPPSREHAARVLSWNIRKGKGWHGRGISFEALADALGGLGCDVVLLQEVFHAWRDDAIQQTEALAERLGLHVAYGPNASYRKGHHGNATLSRFPVASFDNTDLSTNPVERRGLLHAVLDVSGHDVHVFNTHLGLNAVQRRKQIDRIADVLHARCAPSDHVLLAGDFNDWLGRLDDRVLARCDLEGSLLRVPAALRRSWPSRRPMFALDRFYTRNLRVDRVRVHRKPPWNRLSDHLPIEATVSPMTQSSAPDPEPLPDAAPR